MNVNAYLFRLIAPELYRYGLSANKAIEFARKIGISYRRKDMLEDWRNVLDLKKQWEGLQNVKKDARPSLDLIEYSPFASEGKFRWVARVEYYTEGNVFSEKHISFETDWIPTRREIERTFDEIVENQRSRYGVYDVVSVKWVGAWYNPA